MTDAELAADTAIRTFNFQIDNNSDFSSPIYDIHCDHNFYNFLAPLANGTWYWRVDFNDAGVAAWEPTRTFIIDDTSVDWDRSIFTNESTLATRADHPHMLFNASNKAAMKAYLDSTAPHGWSDLTFWPSLVIGQAWWPDELPPDGWLSTSGAGKIGTYAYVVSWTAFAHQMLGGSTYIGAREALPLIANYYLTGDTIAGNSDGDGTWADEDDIYHSHCTAILEGLALGYDWMYDDMTAPQRASVIAALEARCRYILNAEYTTGIAPGPATTSAFEDKYPDGTLKVNQHAQYRTGHSHLYPNFYRAMWAAFAGYGENSYCRQLFDKGVNYMLGVTNPYGPMGIVNAAMRGYAQSEVYISGGGVSMLHTHMMASVMFPEAEFQKNPWWSTNLDNWIYMCPIGFVERGNATWGDSAHGTVYTAIGDKKFGRDLAKWMQPHDATRAGKMYRHWQNQFALPPYSGGSTAEVVDALPYLYHFQTVPTPASEDAGGYITDLGWAVGHSISPSTTTGFEDGVSFYFCARPSGHGVSHDNNNDGHVEITAYGAAVTDAGAGFNNYSRAGWASNCPGVNGRFPNAAFYGPIQPWYSKFIGWKETDDWIYVAADLTNSYPTKAYTVSGNQILYTQAEYGDADLEGLVKVQRHVLFGRRKYFVIWDDFENDEAATFSATYVVQPNTLTLDSTNRDWSYETLPNQDAQTVTVYVDFINDNSTISLTQKSGEGATGVKQNVITSQFIDTSSAASDYLAKSHVLWISNATPATTFNMLHVIFVTESGEDPPTITRIDDHTAHIEHPESDIDHTIDFSSSQVEITIAGESLGNRDGNSDYC